jgi:hypothetical protein
MDPATPVRCRLCLSEIDARARRCPHCARWQSWLSSAAAFVRALIMLAAVGTWVPIGLMMERALSGGAPSLATPADLRLVDSTMQTGHWGGEDRLVVLGRIRNQGREPLELVQVEAQFRDGAGALVDTTTEFLFWRPIGGILPG